MAAAAPVARTRPPRPRLAKARAKAAPRTSGGLQAGIVWIVIVAAMLAGLVALNVAVLRVNLAFDELGQKRAKLRAGERRPRLAARERRVDRPHSAGRCREPSASARLPTRPHTSSCPGNARAEAVRPPHSPAAPRAADGLRDVARPRDVAADRAGGRPQQRASSQQHETVTIPAGRGTIVDRMGVQLAIAEEAVTVYVNPRQVTSPRQVALAAAKTRCRCRRAVPPAARQVEGLRLRHAQGRRGAGEALEKRNLAGVGFRARRARVPAGRRGGSRPRLRRHRQSRTGRPSSSSWSACSVGVTAARRSSRIRSDACSTSCGRNQSGRA